MAVKIIKQFKSEAHSIGPNIWYWGLGEDGMLYRQNADTYGTWVQSMVCSISDIRNIAKEFGDLLIWL